MSTDFKALDLRVLTFALGAKVTRDIHWNSFPASVVHGVLGMFLKDLTCVVAHRNCKKCYLVSSCPYGVIFESPVPEGATRMRKYPQTPHPIRIVVTPWNTPVAREGETFHVRITLVGASTEHLLSLLLAIDTAFVAGVGRRHGGDRGSAEIREIRDLHTGAIWDWSELKVVYEPPIRPMALNEYASSNPASSVSLTFNTPLRIVTNGRINFRPGTRDLIAGLLRRIANLQYFFGGSEWDADFTRILEEADRLTPSSQIERVPARRYSSRQKAELSLSGISGMMTFPDCPPEIVALFQMGEPLGLGKGSTFGLGDYTVIERGE